MEPLDDLLRRLREERRLTQQELGQRAGYTVQVVSTTEGGRNRPSRLAARGLFESLGKAKPLTEGEAYAFLFQCGLVPESPSQHLPPQQLNDFVADGLVRIVPEPPASFADLADEETPTPPIARLARQLELAVGLERASVFLRAALQLVESGNRATTPTTAPKATPTPMLVKPPVVKEGFTVQEFAPVAAPSAPRSASTPPLHRRKAR